MDLRQDKIKIFISQFYTYLRIYTSRSALFLLYLTAIIRQNCLSQRPPLHTPTC